MLLKARRILRKHALVIC